MNYAISILVACAAWSSFSSIYASTSASTKKVAPAPVVAAQSSSPKAPVDAQKVLQDMKKRLDHNREMLGSLKADWQKKRETLQKQVNNSKAKRVASVKSGSQATKTVASAQKSVHSTTKKTVKKANMSTMKK